MIRLNDRFATLALALLMGISGTSSVQADSDAEIERCLTEGKILKGEEVLVGLTKPVKIELDCDGSRQKVLFKSLDVNKPGLYRLANGSSEFNFTDRYQYERAAYLLDRELGMNMVPVAVLRKYKGQTGAFVAWISGAVNGKRLTTDLPGVTVAALERQKSVMRMFDALIYNVDRRPENYLVDETTGKLYLIDHSQSFRIKQELQVEFADNRIWMSEDIYERLVALDKERLAVLVDEGLISRGQLKSVLARRDLILAKIDRDRQQFGDDSVFLVIDDR